jgi:hypothetical protein
MMRGTGAPGDPWILEGRLRTADVWGRTSAGLGPIDDVEEALVKAARAVAVREILIQIRAGLGGEHERKVTGVITQEARVMCPMESGELALSMYLGRRVGAGHKVRIVAWRKEEQARDDVEDDVLLRKRLSEAFRAFLQKTPEGITFSLRDVVARPMRSRMVMYRLRLLAREAVGRGELQMSSHERRRRYAKPFRDAPKGTA